MRSLSRLRASTSAASVVEYATLLGIMGVISVFAIVEFGGEVSDTFNEPVEVLANNGLPSQTANEAQASGVAPSGPVVGWSVAWAGDDATYTSAGQFYKQFSVFYHDPAESGPPALQDTMWAVGVAGRGDGVSGIVSQALANTLLVPDESEYHAGNMQVSNAANIAFTVGTSAILPNPGAFLCEVIDPVNFNTAYTAAVSGVAITDITTNWIDASLVPASTNQLQTFGDVGETLGATLDAAYAASADGALEVVSTFRCVRDALPGDAPVLGQIPYSLPPMGGGGGFGFGP